MSQKLKGKIIITAIALSVVLLTTTNPSTYALKQQQSTTISIHRIDPIWVDIMNRVADHFLVLNGSNSPVYIITAQHNLLISCVNNLFSNDELSKSLLTMCDGAIMIDYSPPNGLFYKQAVYRQDILPVSMSTAFGVSSWYDMAKGYLQARGLI